MNRCLAMSLFTSTLFFVCTPPSLHAAPPLRYVEIQSASSDGLGQELVREVKRAVRQSSGLVEMDAGPRVVVVITTLDPDASKEVNGSRTVYSVVWSYRADEDAWPTYFATTLGTCGRAGIDSIVSAIVTGTEKVLEDAS